ncbi:MAG: hypothetical protein K0Q92_441 [Steroidobacteraceae bacterium]|jgi:uncharacterized protein YecE (DUF72 family)|nr:hypothetical protein [Steroidobacteraceae bacterium]
MADVRIGISGWRYEPWRGIFYPPGLTQQRELEFASRAFSSVEINGSFYSLQSPSSWKAWYDATPPGFLFSVKGPRYVTHILRLKNVRKPLANFFASGVLALREKLGPLLWQFPPSMRFDADRFAHFFRLLPADTAQALKLARSRDSRMHGRSVLRIDATRPLRHAVEIRHDSFATPEFIALLREHQIALVVADTAGKWPLIEDITSDFMYLRLHGDKELYASGYTDAALDRWAERIRAWSRGRDPRDARHAGPTSRREPHGRASCDVFCYFDNDVKVRAPFDADRLRQKLGIARAEGDFRFPARSALRRAKRPPPLSPLRWRLGGR